jgi:hypothetical protein
LRLASKDGHRVNHKYAIFAASTAPPNQRVRDYITITKDELKKADSVRRIIENNNGKFTEPELARFIKESTNLGASIVDDLSAIVTMLTDRSRIYEDDSGKLYGRPKLPPPPPPFSSRSFTPGPTPDFPATVFESKGNDLPSDES